MWRVLWSPSGSRQALSLLEQLPQVTELRSCSAATATLQHLLAHPQIASLHGGWSQCQPIQSVTSSGCRSFSSSELSSAASSSDSTSQAQQQEQEQQDETLHTSSFYHKQPAAAAAAAERRWPFARVEKSGLVTLPHHSTASGYQESFMQASPPSSSSDSTSSSSGAAGKPLKVPVQDLQLPQEQLRIQLRQEVKQEEVQEEVDVYSLSRSLMGHENFSFEATASAAAADDAAPHQQQQQQQLSASDRQLLEKLVGIMTKDGKKSRARRLLLDAMHIIKQNVAKGQQGA